MQYVCEQSAAVSEETVRKAGGWIRLGRSKWIVRRPLSGPRMLDLFEDANLYQTWSYGEVRWGRKNLSHLVLKRNDEVVGMAQLRIIRPTRLNFGMAYLRWGPLCHRRGRELDARGGRGDGSCSARGIRLQTSAIAADPAKCIRRVASAANSFNPLFPVSHKNLASSANLYRTFILDLTPPLEELRRNLDEKWRNKLTRSEKKGLKVVAGNGIDEYRTFCRMYHADVEAKSIRNHSGR